MGFGSPPDETDDRERRLDAAVVAFHSAREAGEEPRAADWIARYPDLAPELEQHFQMDGLIGWVADADVPRAPESGTQFGPYRVVRVIGRGGMGVVYEAERVDNERRVALKVLPSCALPEPRQAARFRREAAVVASLDHPHILPILDSGEYGGIPYFAMPKIDGMDLRSVVRLLRHAKRSAMERTPNVRGSAGPLQLGGPTVEHARAVAAIGFQAAGALDYAHAQGVIHRDVKPSNLLLDTLGVVFVTDFGLAHARDRDELTETGDLAGTLRYLSPERLRGWSDPRSDVYSLGLTLYELLTLHPAFDAIDRSRLIRAIAQDAPRRPRSWNREIPRVLETIIRKAIEREPAHRYQSAAAMADDLQRFLHGQPIRARRVNALRRTWSWSRRNKRKTGGIAVIVVSFIGMVAGAFWVEHIRRAAAESAANESQFQVELLGIERFRTRDHQAGWSSIVMERAKKASKTRRDERLRDQAAASLAGLDAPDRYELEGIGGSTVAFNTDGSLLLIGGREPSETCDGRARIYDVGGKRITHVSTQGGPGPVAFTKAGKALQLTRVEKVGLCLWDVADNRVAMRLEESPAETPAVLALSPDGIRAAAAIWVADKPTIRVWDGATGRIVRDLPGEATVLAFSSECERLAAGNDRGEVHVWSPGDSWSSTSQKATGNRVQALCFTRDPRRDAEGRQGWLLAVGDAGAEISILDLTTSSVRTRCIGSFYEVATLAFAADGTILASGGRHAARLWDAAMGTLLLEVGGYDRESGIALSARGDRLATCHERGDGPPWVDVWKLEYDRGIATLRGLTGPISKVVFSPDGRRIAALCHDWRIGVWDLVDGRLLGVLEGPRGLYADNAALAFRPDGRQLAISSGQFAQLWDLDPCRLRKLWPLPPGLSDALAFRSSSELLLCRFECADGVHRPYDNTTVQFPRVVQIRNLLGHDSLRPIGKLTGYQRLNAAAASPDGRMFVLSAIRDGPDPTRHVVASIGSRNGEVLWLHDFCK
jgi:eukaryotic-like serine/threonine-protein kinase